MCQQGRSTVGAHFVWAAAEVPKAPSSRMDGAQRSKVLEKGRGGVRMVDEAGTLTPFELDEVEWQSDAAVSVCQGTACNTPFSFMSRKHHCRRCGKIYCDKCCGHKLGLPRLLYADPQRVCNSCKATAEFELTFFTKMIPVLRKGGIFKVSLNGKDLGQKFVFLSADHTVLRFTEKSSKDTRDSLPPLRVQAIHCHEDTDKQVVSVGTKKDGQFQLTTPEKDLAKQWRKATRHVVKILHAKQSPRRSGDDAAETAAK